MGRLGFAHLSQNTPSFILLPRKVGLWRNLPIRDGEDL